MLCSFILQLNLICLWLPNVSASRLHISWMQIDLTKCTCSILDITWCVAPTPDTAIETNSMHCVTYSGPVARPSHHWLFIVAAYKSEPGLETFEGPAPWNYSTASCNWKSSMKGYLCFTRTKHHKKLYISKIKDRIKNRKVSFPHLAYPG